MSRLRLSFAIGVALGLLSANCSKPDPKTLNGTALFVTNYFKTDYRVRSLLFIGQNEMGNEVFKRDTRPSPPSATDLAAPQTVRVLLANSLAGKPMTLSVFALDVNNEYVEFGSSQVTPQDGIETDVTIDMIPFDNGGDTDAGTDGGVDSGTPDAGGPDGGGDGGTLPDGGTIDAGTFRCDCPTGCCIPDAGLPDGSSCAPSATATSSLPNGVPLMVTFQFCGMPKAACQVRDFCDPIRASGCIAGLGGVPECGCGTAPQCGQGMRCVPNQQKDAYICICDTLSECQGCCGMGANGVVGCKVPPIGTACGAAGLACEMCTSAGTGGASCSLTAAGGNGVCSGSAACLGCLAANKCCSENQCVPADFPVCRLKSFGATSGPSVCFACDILRADHCSPTTAQCACGNTPQCPKTQFCARDGGNSYCVGG